MACLYYNMTNLYDNSKEILKIYEIVFFWINEN